MIWHASGVLLKRIFVRQHKWMMDFVFQPKGDRVLMILNDPFKEGMSVCQFRRVIGIQAYEYDFCRSWILALMREFLRFK